MGGIRAYSQLRRAIDRQPRRRRVRQIARRQHNAPPTILPLHSKPTALDDIEHTPQVDIKDPVVRLSWPTILFRIIEKRLVLADSCVGESEVDMANLLEDCFDGFPAGDVAGDEGRLREVGV